MNGVTIQDYGQSSPECQWPPFPGWRTTKVNIPESIRSRARKVAQQFGYRPNALAKGWVSGLSKLIGFISDGAPHAGQVIRGSQDGAWHQGMILLIVDTNGEKR